MVMAASPVCVRDEYVSFIVDCGPQNSARIYPKLALYFCSCQYVCILYLSVLNIMQS